VFIVSSLRELDKSEQTTNADEIQPPTFGLFLPGGRPTYAGKQVL
jgi:hypothetical protein